LPRTDPTASFDVAVRHLFRHLSEPRELRRNPLVSQLFDTADSPSALRSDASVVAGIRRSIGEGAEVCCGPESLPARNREQRIRQFAIVSRCVLEGDSPEDVAMQLGISERQLRRERADICKRIAMYVRAKQLAEWTPRLEILDTLRFQFERASAQAEAGEYESAIRSYDDILSSSAGTADKVESFCKRAEVELECGKLGAAQTSLSDATTLLETDVRAFATKSLAASRANVALLQSKLAWATADFSTAKGALDSARRALETVRSVAGKRIKELFIGVLLDTASRSCDQGDFAASAKALGEIEAFAQTMPHMSLPLQIDWIMQRNALAIVSARQGTSFGIGEYATHWNRALDLAKTCRSLKRIVEAEAELARIVGMEAELTNGRLGLGSKTALTTARRVVFTARELRNYKLLTAMSVSMADYLVSSDGWREVPDILQDAEQNAVDGTCYWVVMMMIKSAYHVKAGRPLEGLQFGHEAYQAAKAMDNPRVTAAALRRLASITYTLGRKNEAAEYIRDSVAISERSASAFACVQMYRMASAITGDARYGKAAAELQHALMAR
jgi:hypothetical protein